MKGARIDINRRLGSVGPYSLASALNPCDSDCITYPGYAPVT